MGVSEGRPTISKKTINCWEGIIFKEGLGVSYECLEGLSCNGCHGCQGFSTYIKLSKSSKGQNPSQGSQGSQDKKYIPAPTPLTGMCHICRQHSRLTHTTPDSDVGIVCQPCAEVSE